MSDDQLKTAPAWKPAHPQPARKGPSDRLLIALLTAIVAILEGWHAIVPDAKAAPDTEVVRRLVVLEATVGGIQTSVNALDRDVAVLKDRSKKP